MPAETLAPNSLRRPDAAMHAHRGVRSATSLAGAMDAVRAWTSSPLLWILVCALALRIVGIDRPLVGTFATKSAVHAMVARNWALGRAPLHQPTIDLISDGSRAWHLMEWPAMAYAAGLGWKLCGGSLDAWGRGISIACSLASVWLTYRLAGRWFGPRAAQGAAAIMAFSPVSIVYGQSFLLEASLAALALTTLDAFDRWLTKRRTIYLAVAAIAFALAVLTKVYMLLLLLPLATHIFAATMRSSAAADRPPLPTFLRSTIPVALAFGATLIPVALWYQWMLSVSPTVGPAAEYHPLSRATIHGFPHPLLFSSAYYLRLCSDFATVVLTPLGVLLAGFGLVDARFRRHLPLLAASMALLVAFPLKFMAANYYYVVLLPALALAAGLGWERLRARQLFGKRAMQVVVAVSLLIALRYAIGPAYRTQAEDRDVVAAAEVLRSVTVPEERVATMHGSTLDLLYYCDRPGWAFDVADVQLDEQIELARREGAKKFIVVGLDSVARNPATSELLASLALEQSGDDWRLYSLATPALP